jgi:hypothetical protein
MNHLAHRLAFSRLPGLVASTLMGVLLLSDACVRADDQRDAPTITNLPSPVSTQGNTATNVPGTAEVISSNQVSSEPPTTSNPLSGVHQPVSDQENSKSGGLSGTNQSVAPSPALINTVQGEVMHGATLAVVTAPAQPVAVSSNQPPPSGPGPENDSQTNAAGLSAPQTTVDSTPSQLDLVKLHVIVIKDNPTMAPQPSDAEKAGKDLADEIHKKLNSGSDFQVLAMMYSQDPSKKYGGNLGWVERRAIKKKLADIAFSMKTGQISEVIPMDHRYLILKVDGVRPAGETRRQAISSSGTSAPNDAQMTPDSTGMTGSDTRKPANSGMPVDAPPNLEDTPDKMAASAPGVPASESVTVNLITRLVHRGILTKQDAADLIRQANEDAQRASQMAQATQQALSQSASAQQMATQEAAPPNSDDQVSVSYVPEIVKAEMKDEIKRDVIATAQSEGWTQPNIPEWLSKFRPFTDFRLRFQGNYYPESDSFANSQQMLDTLNFNAINTSSQPFNMAAVPGPQGPYDAFFPNSIFPSTNSFTGYNYAQLPTQSPPTYNTTQQRQQTRIRFRFGADMNLGENFTSGFRIGTGQNGSPVSENQTLGQPGANNQGGDFSSYAIWIDRAFLKYEIGDNPDRMAAITFGRFDNPFYTPTTIMWANDIGFDGIAAQARYKIAKGVTPFATVGIFPYFNTDLNFPQSAQTKTSSYDKYLYAGQVGLDWKITKDLNFKSSLGYYYFQNAQGQVSAPMVTPSAQVQGNTDDTRPSFAQRGNTYMELRNIQKVNMYDSQGIVTNTATANYIYNPTNTAIPPQYQNQYQYFGLITPFNILSANGRLEYRHWEPFVVSLSGEWDRNLAFNSGNILTAGPSPGADNNYNETLISGPVNNINNGGSFNGGNNAWIMQMKVGSGALQKRWDWDFGVAYRYVESDAVIDGFCDSDFGGGGTNLKGWSVGGNLALSRNVFIGLRWLSANGIAGPTYKSDIVQLDINARF